MNGWTHNLAIWVAILVPIFTAFVFVFLPLFKQKPERQEDYLKRAARKHSVPPLDLR